MSLNWNLEGINNYNEVCWIDDPENPDSDKKYMNPVTESLIWHTMGVGIGEITENNVAEFYQRSKFWTKLFGGMINSYNDETGKYESRDFTAEEIHDHIGLSTNVSYESDTKWRNRIYKMFKKDTKFERDFEREIEKKNKETANV